MQELSDKFYKISIYRWLTTLLYTLIRNQIFDYFISVLV